MTLARQCYVRQIGGYDDCFCKPRCNLFFWANTSLGAVLFIVHMQIKEIQNIHVWGRSMYKQHLGLYIF